MRIRAIKPEFWTDARTGEWDAPRALFYVGIWQVADDAGRLRLDARLIRAELDPFDAKFGGVRGVEKLVEDLVRDRRILPYEVDGLRFGLVAHFADHQVINKPTKSRLPAPPEGLRESSGSPPVAVPPDSCVEGKGTRDQGSGSREGSTDGAGADAPAPAASVDAVLALWNEAAARSGLVASRGSRRVRETVRKRLRAAGWLEAFRQAVAYVERSDFHRGLNVKTAPGKDPWRANLEWLLKESKAEEVADLAAAPVLRLPAVGAAPAADRSKFNGSKAEGF